MSAIDFYLTVEKVRAGSVETIYSVGSFDNPVPAGTKPDTHPVQEIPQVRKKNQPWIIVVLTTLNNAFPYAQLLPMTQKLTEPTEPASAALVFSSFQDQGLARGRPRRDHVQREVPALHRADQRGRSFRSRRLGVKVSRSLAAQSFWSTAESRRGQ